MKRMIIAAEETKKELDLTISNVDFDVKGGSVDFHDKYTWATKAAHDYGFIAPNEVDEIIDPVSQLLLKSVGNKDRSYHINMCSFHLVYDVAGSAPKCILGESKMTSYDIAYN